MRVRVIIQSESDTECQDKFLKEALERLAWNVGTNTDRILVLSTYKSRALPPNLKVELL